MEESIPIFHQIQTLNNYFV